MPTTYYLPRTNQALLAEKNIALFASLGVMSKEETLARADAMHEQ